MKLLIIFFFALSLSLRNIKHLLIEVKLRHNPLTDANTKQIVVLKIEHAQERERRKKKKMLIHYWVLIDFWAYLTMRILFTRCWHDNLIPIMKDFFLEFLELKGHVGWVEVDFFAPENIWNEVKVEHGNEVENWQNLNFSWAKIWIKWNFSLLNYPTRYSRKKIN